LGVHIKEAYHNLTEAIGPIYENREARNISDWVIEDITGWKRSKRVVHQDILLTDEQSEKFESYKQELLKGRPVQYVLGSSWFCGMSFFVDERVLIPRPETEELVDTIKKMFTTKKEAVEYQTRIIDIGTGSGCIAISIKKIFPHWEVWAVDESIGALDVAIKNGENLKAEVIFKKADILKESKIDSMPTYDVIVSNPPYIPLSDKHEMADHVLKYEPHLALFVTDNDPLSFYKSIIAFSEYHLLRGGMIFFETHAEYANHVAQLLEENEFEQVEIKLDMQGRERMVTGKKIGTSL
jgi:release factor glutamine methyltransferase